MDLHAKVFGGYSLLQLALMAGGILVAAWLIKMAFGLLGGGAKTEDKFHQRVKCTNCGWVGTVPKFKGACRQCGNTSLTPT